jgi:hypothetical protein
MLDCSALRLTALLLLLTGARSAPSEIIDLDWVRQFGTTGRDASFGLSVDGDGNVYVVGLSTDDLGGPNAGGNDASLTKFDSDGNAQWSGQIGTASSDIA